MGAKVWDPTLGVQEPEDKQRVLEVSLLLTWWLENIHVQQLCMLRNLGYSSYGLEFRVEVDEYSEIRLEGIGPGKALFYTLGALEPNTSRA